jgi:PTS system fructose-specific IIC component
LVDFQAKSYGEAIEKLVDHMIRSHHLEVDRATLLATLLEPEGKAPTILGGGLASPHAALADEHPPVGVMGISRRGLDFDEPDGKPVHCIVLLGTSHDQNKRHLQVLATLARTVGTDPWIRDRLFQATTAAHAAEILHGEESEHFNVFLE